MPSIAAPRSPTARVMRRSLPSLISTASSRALRSSADFDRSELARNDRSDLRPSMRVAGIVVLAAQTGGATGFDHLLDTKYFALHALCPAFRRLLLPEPALTPSCARTLKTDRLP